MDFYYMRIDGKGRINEIAMLISGSKITEESKKVASDLINER